MSGRALLLALGSCVGLLSGRALDGLSLLPGVHESEEIRRIALAPTWTAAGLAAVVLLALAAARLAPRSRLAAVALLVVGQTVVLAAPEMAGRAGESSGEAPLVVAVAVQVLLSLLTVSTAFLVLRLIATEPVRALGGPAPVGRPGPPSYLVQRRPLRVGGLGGRAPPDRLAAPVPHPSEGDPCRERDGGGALPWPHSSRCSPA